MTDIAKKIGSGGLPPSNVLAANTYNPKIGTTTAHPGGFPPGTPVVQSLLVDGVVIPGQASDVDTSSLTGLAIMPGVAGDHGLVQFQGVMNLSTSQWDVATGGSGGLTRGIRYYLSATTEGGITATPPSDPGTFVVQVGVALSSQDLLVQICAPVENA
jgi:hypothetical protein